MQVEKQKIETVSHHGFDRNLKQEETKTNIPKP